MKLRTRYTPESYHKRLEEWAKPITGEYDPSLMLRRTPDERAKRRISDVERAALTLLQNAEVSDQELKQAISRFLTDPAAIDTGEPPKRGKAELETERNELILDYYHERDRLAWALLVAVANHRERGEDGATIETSLSADLVVTSSLAAEIVQYHKGMMRLQAWFYEELQLIERHNYSQETTRKIF